MAGKGSPIHQAGSALAPELRIVDNSVHPGTPRSLLHIDERSSLLIDLQLHLRRALQLAGLRAPVRPLILGCSILGLYGRPELIDSRLERGQSMLLSQDLPFPLFGSPLLRDALLAVVLLRADFRGPLRATRLLRRRWSLWLVRYRRGPKRHRACRGIGRQILIGYDFWLRCGIGIGVFFFLCLAILPRYISKRLPIAGSADHQKAGRTRLFQA